MAHTPGPWVFEKLGSSYIIGRSLNSYEWNEKVGQFFGEQDNSDADARLIAAAPELLAALQLLVDYVEMDYPVEVAMKAIKKATGGDA